MGAMSMSRLMMLLLVVMTTPVAGRLTGRACEGETLHIGCHVNGRQIHISYVVFDADNPSSPVCNSTSSSHPPAQPGDCTSTRTDQIVRRRCEGEVNCSIPVDRNTFLRDVTTCISPVTYLLVNYVCISGDASVTRSTSTAKPDVTSRALTCRSKVMCGVAWPETSANTWAYVNCPNSTDSSARWRCDQFGHWRGTPDSTGDCCSLSSRFQRLLSSSNDTFDADVMTSVADLLLSASDYLTPGVVIAAIGPSPLSGEDINVVTDVMNDVVRRTDTVAMDANSSPTVRHVVGAVVNTSDRLLSSRAVHSWRNLSTEGRAAAASRMLRTVEHAALTLARTLQPEPAVRRTFVGNIVLEYGVVNESTTVGEAVQFPAAVDRLSGTPWQNVTDTVTLPVDALRQLQSQQPGRIEFAFVMYNNIGEWLSPAQPAADTATDRADDDNDDDFDDDDDGSSSERNAANCTQGRLRRQVVISKIISVAVTGSSSSRRINLTEPLTITFTHLQQPHTCNVSCSFWKYYNSSSAHGEWSPVGCSLVDSNVTHTTCQCYHLTSFAVIMSPVAPKLSAIHELILTVFTCTGCILSIICLALAFLVFQFCRSVQGDRNTIHKNLVVNLLVANILFLVGMSQENESSVQLSCSVLAGLQHYFFLTSFAWMCLEGIQLYVMLVEVFEAEKSRVLWYYLTAYGVPAVIVGISAAVYHEGYGTPHHCWLSTDKGFIWSFIAPVIATLTVNTVMLSIALSAMYEHSRMSTLWRREHTNRQHIWSCIRGAFVLEVLLGLTWAFGLAFVNEHTTTFAYIFSVLNSLQGTFIFVFHCVMNEKIRHDCRRGLGQMSCLPDSLRLRFGIARSTFVSTGQNPHSNYALNHNNNNYLTRVLGGRHQQKHSSNSTALSKSNSISTTRRPEMRQEEPIQKRASSVVKATDSVTEDAASYLEPSAIRLRESEFEQRDDHTDSDGSLIEGSVVDTDYIDKLLTKTANGRSARQRGLNEYAHQ